MLYKKNLIIIFTILTILSIIIVTPNGARMVAYIGSYGTSEFENQNFPKPSAIIMQYTGYSDYTENDPPTFACVGENDNIANWKIMSQRIDNLNNLGITTEFHKYPNIGHGFGLGIGTSAENWFNYAINFWENQIL